MKFESAIRALIIPILLAGCAGSNIGLRAGNPSSVHSSAQPEMSSHSSAAIQAEIRSNPYLGMLILGTVMLGIQDDPVRWSGAASSRKPPELAEGRSIAERDCSQPLEPVYANLRCK